MRQGDGCMRETDIQTPPAVLAVDVGFVATGWAVLAAGRIISVGCIRTDGSDRKRGVRASDSDAERTACIARQLDRVIRGFQIRGVIAELPTAGAKGARAIACMARASAIVATVVELHGLPAEFVTPMDVKKVTGTATASKDEVEAAVIRRWPAASLPKLKCEREHVADALGAYLAAENGTLVRTLLAQAASQRSE